ncbi:MAG TPA: preQ(1) synthase [Acidimicrobiales bacterium]|jgi:7-cyano-7-deazaguanine reductase|nr:preQ(1) synthase [Acidimicrobiales bacterium]
MTDTSKLTHLGARTQYRYDHPGPDLLESFAHGQSNPGWVVGLECREFTSLCPITGQPDFGRILIQYVPDQLCVESKSLKLYLGAYRNHGSFHEACTNQIADDLVTAIAPRYLRVYGDFLPRGGIAIQPLVIRASTVLTAEDEEQCRALMAQYDSVRSTATTI